MDQQPEVKPLEHSGGYQNGHLIRRIVSLRAVCFDQIANGPKPQFLDCIIIIIIIIILSFIPPRDDMIISRRNTYAYYRGNCIIVYIFTNLSRRRRQKMLSPPPQPPPPLPWSTAAELLQLDSVCTYTGILYVIYQYMVTYWSMYYILLLL